MAFNGFGGAGGNLAQQLEVARSAGTSYYVPEAGSSLSVSVRLFNPSLFSPLPFLPCFLTSGEKVIFTCLALTFL